MQENVNEFKGSETMWFFCDGTHPEQNAISALPTLASGIEPRSHLGLAIAEASWDYIHGYHGYYIHGYHGYYIMEELQSKVKGKSGCGVVQ